MACRLIAGRTIQSVGAVIGGALLVVGTAMTAQAQTIYACKNNKTGLVRIVNSPANCKKGETPISWDQQGPQGPPGPPGHTVLTGGSNGQALLPYPQALENNMGPGNGFTNGPAGIVAVPMPPGTLSSLRVFISVPPDSNAAESYTFQLCTNPGFGGTCTLTCTISGSAPSQSCADTTHTMSINGGDRIFVGVSLSNNPPPPRASAQWSVDFQPSGN